MTRQVPRILQAVDGVPYPRLTGAEPCRTSPSEQWFDEAGTGAAAAALCRGCPVLQQCADWALANPQHTQYGVWGGMSPRTRRDRRAERRKAAAAAHLKAA